MSTLLQLEGILWITKYASFTFIALFTWEILRGPGAQCQQWMEASCMFFIINYSINTPKKHDITSSRKGFRYRSQLSRCLNTPEYWTINDKGVEIRGSCVLPRTPAPWPETQRGPFQEGLAIELSRLNKRWKRMDERCQAECEWCVLFLSL